MAIIKYQLVNGSKPSGITDGGYWLNGSQELIGIGSGVVTELTMSQLLTYVLALHSANPMIYFDPDAGFPQSPQDYVPNSDPSSDPIPRPVMTQEQVTATVNAWCTERGIS